jgi:hypothetical protein
MSQRRPLPHVVLRGGRLTYEGPGASCMMPTAPGLLSLLTPTGRTTHGKRQHHSSPTLATAEQLS